MNKKQYISKLIEEAINSADHIERAAPKPFLLTRIHARMYKTTDTIWEKLVRFIGRPSFSMPALGMLVLVNIMAVVYNRAEPIGTAAEQAAQVTSDDLSDTVATIYDIENSEP